MMSMSEEIGLPVPPDAHLFSHDYWAARERLLTASRAAGAWIGSYAEGGGDQELVCDAIWIGPKDAPNVLVMVSGTHGQEAFAGSAVQLAVASNPASLGLRPDQALLLVHAVNPYGFANETRTTAANVDLNRNFVDHAAVPANPIYGELHEALCLEAVSADALAAMHAALEGVAARHGKRAVADALARGQYERPDGLFYGGSAPEWSRCTLEAIAAEFLSDARQVAVIDWHTGLGGYGEAFFLCFDPPGDWRRARAERWWGAGAFAADAAAYGEGGRPAYNGLLVHGLAAAVPRAEVVGVVIEFGTYPVELMTEALAIDRWLRFAQNGSPGTAAEARRLMMERIVPSDPQWRSSVVLAGRAIARQALAGLAADPA